MRKPRFNSFPHVLLALSLLAVGAYGQGLDKETAKGNITIQLPAGWELKADGVLSAQPKQLDRDGTGQFQAALLIKQDKGTRIDAAAEQANVAKAVGVYTVTENPVKYNTTSGVEGVKFSGTYRVNGRTTVRTCHYMFLKNGQIYTITFTCLASKWTAYQQAVEASVATFNAK